jgi:hypothetical protein
MARCGLRGGSTFLGIAKRDSNNVSDGHQYLRLDWHRERRGSRWTSETREFCEDCEPLFVPLLVLDDIGMRNFP